MEKFGQVINKITQNHKALVDSFKKCYAPGDNGRAVVRVCSSNLVTVMTSNSAVLDQVRRDILLDTGAMGHSVDVKKTKLRNLRPASAVAAPMCRGSPEQFRGWIKRVCWT